MLRIIEEMKEDLTIVKETEQTDSERRRHFLILVSYIFCINNKGKGSSEQDITKRGMSTGSLQRINLSSEQQRRGNRSSNSRRANSQGPKRNKRGRFTSKDRSKNYRSYDKKNAFSDMKDNRMKFAEQIFVVSEKDEIKLENEKKTLDALKNRKSVDKVESNENLKKNVLSGNEFTETMNAEELENEKQSTDFDDSSFDSSLSEGEKRL